jgi:hypothetical protein
VRGILILAGIISGVIIRRIIYKVFYNKFKWRQEIYKAPSPYPPPRRGEEKIGIA